LESDLTRIVALSWEHGRESDLKIILDEKDTKALVVAFGKKRATVTDVGRAKVMPGSLDDDTFQVFVERIIQGESATLVRLIPERVIPVKLVGGSLRNVKQIPGPDAKAAAFVFVDAIYEKYAIGHKILVVIKGDFVLDETGKRAIDAEFVRGELPTGDRAGGSEYGIQGGTFESWVTVPRG